MNLGVRECRINLCIHAVLRNSFSFSVTLILAIHTVILLTDNIYTMLSGYAASERAAYSLDVICKPKM